MTNIDRVKEFHETYGQFINDKRALDNFDKSLLSQRYNLISEETNELVCAIINDDRLEILDALTDIDYVIDGTYLTFGMEYPNPKERQESREEIKQQVTFMGKYMSHPFMMLGSCVMLVEEFLNNEIDKVEDTLQAMTVILDVMFEEYSFVDVREAAGIEVHRSNMSKLGENGKPMYRESDGKVMKGPNYFKPNLRQFVNDDQRRNSGTG